MATTIVGLYHTEADVTRVTDELSNHGFEHYEVNRDDRTGADLRDWLEHRGVPGSEAEEYAIGVDNGGRLVTIEASDDRTDEALEIMMRHERSAVGGGTAGIPAAATTNDWTSSAARDEREPRDTKGVDEQQTFEVVEEEIDIAKREVEGGSVRVRSYVTERPVDEEVRLRTEHIDVERRPVDRSLSKGEADEAFEERTVAMTETSEEAVVGKRSHVVEEVVISKHHEDRTEHVHDTVRRMDVEVERTDDVQTSDRERFQTHHRDTLGGAEHDYTLSEPAYRYGAELANHADYQGLSWTEIEPEAREQWVRQNGETWQEFEPAVRYGYEDAIERRHR